MRITKVENCPSDIRYFDDHDDDLENKLEPKDVRYCRDLPNAFNRDL